MIGNSSLLAAVLTVVSVLSLSLLSLLCLRCKRKSKIIQEDHQIYNQQTFQREGSVFAVTRSKTVTRVNQITSGGTTPREDFPAACVAAGADEQSDYGNITDERLMCAAAHTGCPEHTAPLPISLYENEEISAAAAPAGIYANIDAPSVKDDDDDYENSEFLDKAVDPEDDEPDYVNENGGCD
uniref:LAT2 domain-containing protein isoform X2 n=1 Tax=Scatophagus argus TaxID=75038 RepID=UPI001ED80401|nr:LAT2 domain-containing protein isoform X2 [Scatophagus argus]